jgi:hypothetical protein
VSPRPSHFRAHDRRAVRLSVGVTGQRAGAARQAAIVDVSLAGAGLETEDELVPGERLELSFTTPALWDPLTIFAIVTWAEPPRPNGTVDALGRPRTPARAGVAFEYPDPPAVLAMFELLASLTYD